jgi:hypothetical protein
VLQSRNYVGVNTPLFSLWSSLLAPLSSPACALASSAILLPLSFTSTRSDLSVIAFPVQRERAIGYKKKNKSIQAVEHRARPACEGFKTSGEKGHDGLKISPDLQSARATVTACRKPRTRQGPLPRACKRSVPTGRFHNQLAAGGELAADTHMSRENELAKLTLG